MHPPTLLTIRRLLTASFVLISGNIAVHAASVPEKIQFNRDVRPILSDKCFACHGFDPKTREADRRLDTPEGALAEIKGVRAIVPGSLEESDAWQRIISKDKSEVMPTPKSHKTLSAEEKETLKRWIEQGAPYQKHWAFEAPQRAPLPEVKDKAWVRNPIDSFVLAKLDAAGLKPAPEADRRTLARRLSLDLIGLPPTPEQVEAFVKDMAPDAYEKYVAKLMAQPQWGEHRGRYWLDAARYADTHGLHFDKYREIWPYRDWVISAFNRNQPFDQFTVEQIAGDLLPNPTREQLIATGFHRCNATTNEGGTIDEETLANYAADRVTATSWVWLGLTTNCAACHDHKFDPITQKDFYSMSAFFRNTTQAALDGNVKDTKPVIYLPQPDDEKRFAALPGEIAAVKQQLTERRAQATKDLVPWLAKATAEQIEVSPRELALHLPLEEGAGVEVKAESFGKPMTFKADGPIEWHEGGKFGKAPQFTNGVHFELGDLAAINHDQPFSVGVWVNVPADFKEGTVVARMDDRSGLQGWELYLQSNRYGVRFATAKPKALIGAQTKNASASVGVWQHVLATYDGSGKAEGFRIFVNGKVQAVVASGAPLTVSSVAAVPLRVGQRETKSPFEGGRVQDVRIYLRALGTGEARSLPDERNLRESFAVVPEKRSAAQKQALENFYLDNFAEPVIEAANRLEVLENEDKLIRERTVVSHIQEEKPGPAMAHILMRGAYDNPGEQVEPAGIQALHPMPSGAPKNRLGLVQWLMAAENPLTSRVTVNRFWQELFGTGIVRTAEDFGSQGEVPTHPELLDWLSVEFRESGWDVKKFYTLLVTSATYRQAAIATPEKIEKDTQNRLFSRGPRFRMDAEMMRDYALATTGTLSLKMGGPGTMPYQPAKVWEVVGMGGQAYTQDKGENLYRRTVYNFWKRMAPPASMEIFNAPARESCVVRRERTNTPIQALVTLNDPQFVEAGRRLAESAMKENPDASAAITKIAERVLLRPLKPAETDVLNKSATDLEAGFNADQAAAKAYIAIGETKPDPSLAPPRLAALAMVASQILNLDETLNK